MVIEVRQGSPLYGSAKGLIDGAYHIFIFSGNKRECFATARRAAGAPDSMNVCIGRGRDIVVDDMGNPGDINAPGGDIGGHQNLKCTIPKAFQCSLATSLGKIPLQRCTAVSGFLKLFPQTFGAVFGPGEYQHRLGDGIFQQL